MNLKRERPPIGVDHGVTLAPKHLFAGIIAMRSIALAGLMFLDQLIPEAIAFRIYRIRARADQNRPLPISVPKISIFLVARAGSGVLPLGYTRVALFVANEGHTAPSTGRRLLDQSDHEKRQY